MKKHIKLLVWAGVLVLLAVYTFLAFRLTRGLKVYHLAVSSGKFLVISYQVTLAIFAIVLLIGGICILVARKKTQGKIPAAQASHVTANGKIAPAAAHGAPPAAPARQADDGATATMPQPSQGTVTMPQAQPEADNGTVIMPREPQGTVAMPQAQPVANDATIIMPREPEGTVVMPRRFCGACGAQIRPGNRFCTACGAQVEGGEDA